ncbi:tetratricopeptide repeat protein [Flammeovirga sp. MY04]|uniref:tetratricopeptide repeat protein n=1 Tax=Flammeovirga sp. MY04 TaxID=1191459 RepID=UPI0013052020|nr:tetratricopeptide repeat protein [Flammeovirga sp. MY04]ANQ51529.2 tetratricopeptide repeat protein [Flammeovirga sp. MY04]
MQIYTSSYGQEDSTLQYRQLYKEVINSDSSKVKELQSCYQYFSQQADTSWMIKTLAGLSDHNARKGNYSDSFAHIWNALDLAEQYQNYTLLFEVNKHLGRLYNVFDKNKEAFFHETKTLEYAKLAVEKEGLTPKSIVSAYYHFVHYYRKNSDFDKALVYLDTCYSLAEKLQYTDDQKIYLRSEKGNILLHQGKYDEAMSILLQSEKDFERINPFYITIISYYLGNAYIKQEEWKLAEKYFRKALKNIEDRNAHFDTKAECLSNLALSLNKQYRYKEAYDVLRASKKVNDEIFSTKSYQNAGLLGIRNRYLEELKERDHIILERDNELIHQKAENLQYRIIVVVAIAIFIILLLMVYLRQKQRQFDSQKEKQQLKAKHQEERNKELIEVKNKELTSFTLQLIDKDVILKDMMQAIQEHASDNKPLLKSVKMNTKHRIQLWDEFDKRFTGVNKDFYNNLKDSFPALTPTELKHCALIKLNFSAKEMAQLLNISINGVNTSRYRIRKKLGLEREENLARVIDGY